MLTKVKKRDNRVVAFDQQKITNAIFKAAQSVGGDDMSLAIHNSNDVLKVLEKRFNTPSVEEIQDVVEEVLIRNGHAKTAKAYILYRDLHRKLRDVRALIDANELINGYLDRTDWRVQENANMGYSLQGLNNHIFTEVNRAYWLNSLYPREARDAHIRGDLHIHDLYLLAPYTYFGKETIITKSERGIELISFAQLYDLCEQPEKVLDLEEGVYAKFPVNLEVLDKDGWIKVLRLVRKQKHRLMRFIKNRGGRSVIVTDNHPMITSKGEREAINIRESEDFLMTIDLNELLKNDSLFTKHHLDLAYELSKRELPNVQGKGQLRLNAIVIDSIIPESDIDNGDLVSIGSHAMPRYIELTEELGRCLGWILADGFAASNKMSGRVSLVQKNMKPLIEVATILRKIGVPSSINHKKDQYVLVIPNKLFRLLLTEVFRIGYGSKDKSIPVQILQFNKEFIKGLLAGLIDGDGNAVGETGITLRLASRTMLEQYATILQLLGAWPRDRSIEGQGTERIGQKGQLIIQRYPLYGVSFRKTFALKLNSFVYEDVQISKKAWMDETSNEWHKVLNNKPVDIPDKYIYDITTETGTLIVNGMWNHNCCGWDLEDLLIMGFGGAPGKLECAPAKHFSSALGQIVNFLYTVQGEVAGAVAFSNFDTLLAPFISFDNLSKKDIKQYLQEFIFNMNVPTRVGHQSPFTNITLDFTVPEHLREQNIIIGGEKYDEFYADFQSEMDLLNECLLEVMLEGDASGKPFTFPIPTVNITKDFDWDNPRYEPLWEVTRKYGIPYFANFVNSNLCPDDVRSMCCRLRLDVNDLMRRAGGLFGSAPSTGSIGVVTLNLARIGYLTKSREAFLQRVGELMDIAKDSLLTKRKIIERFTEQGLYPYSKHYLAYTKERFGGWWSGHFNTIGLCGMNEATLNLLGEDLTNPEARAFSKEVLEFMNAKLLKYQTETGQLFNLEATPAESTAYRFALLDKAAYPDIITAGKDAPYYTNSTQLPVNATNDLFQALEWQDETLPLYTGGSVFHAFLGEQMPSAIAVKNLVQKIAAKFRLPYFTITPTFSICPNHGYLNGEREECPQCDQKPLIYSRVVGYLRPVSEWNAGKISEYKERKVYDLNNPR